MTGVVVETGKKRSCAELWICALVVFFLVWLAMTKKVAKNERDDLVVVVVEKAIKKIANALKSLQISSRMCDKLSL